MSVLPAQRYRHHGDSPCRRNRRKTGFKRQEGASTITQQLIKNTVLTTWTQEKTLGERIKRKVQEQYLAIQLEKDTNDKSKILEQYMNTINLGQNTLGVQAAPSVISTKTSGS